MLTTTKNVTVTGQSNVIEDEKTINVVQLNAVISEKGNSNITSVIVNKNAYELNKTTCRADIDEFTKLIRTMEDEVDE